MCGILGAIGKYAEQDLGAFEQRLSSLRHRGPDAHGVYSSSKHPVVLGHRRLSILDLSDRGRQPMERDGNVITYNGEVYNFTALKKSVPGPYTTQTDTEVILRGYQEHGTAIFSMLDGMFALAIFDSKRGQVVLARDRAGVKPLYYMHSAQGLAFSSEIQALPKKGKISHEALRRYLCQNVIYGNLSIYDDVQVLPPGSVAVYDLKTQRLDIRSYYTPSFSTVQEGSEEQYLDAVHETLRAAVCGALVSDVPIGTFLSSGVDSSLITAIAREYAPDIQSFSVGFVDPSFDESNRAAEIAKHLGVGFHRVHISEKDVCAQVETIMDQFHEPFGNSSAIPTYFLSQFARQQVTVSLSGDGADEFFGGYPLYYLPQYSELYRKIPGKWILKKILDHVPASRKRLSFDYKLRRFFYAADRPYQHAHVLYRAMHNDHILRPEYSYDRLHGFEEVFASVESEAPLHQLLGIDQQTSLPSDHLVKVDRMSMAHSLEVRVPFLNAPVMEAANKLPLHMKVAGTQTKVVLKKILERYLPKEFVYQKKQGFIFPMADLLRGSLCQFMKDTLTPSAIEKVQLIDPEKVEHMMKMHLDGRRDFNRELWGLMNLVRWFSHNG